MFRFGSRKQAAHFSSSFSRCFGTLKATASRNVEDVWSDPSANKSTLMRSGDLLYPIERDTIKQVISLESQGKLTNVWNEQISQLLGENSITFMNPKDDRHRLIRKTLNSILSKDEYLFDRYNLLFSKHIPKFIQTVCFESQSNFIDVYKV